MRNDRLFSCYMGLRQHRTTISDGSFIDCGGMRRWFGKPIVGCIFSHPTVYCWHAGGEYR